MGKKKLKKEIDTTHHQCVEFLKEEVMKNLLFQTLNL